MSETRELRSVSCANCDICLAIADETLERKCAACGHLNRVPRSLIEDSDFLRRLAFDADDEARMALARVVDGLYSPPDFPRWAVALVTLIGAGIGGYSAYSDGWGSMLAWTLGGAIVPTIVVGWTVQWIQSTTAAGVMKRTQRHVQENAARVCPKCDISVDAAVSGSFACTGCKSELLSSNTLIGISSMSRQQGWDKQAKVALEGADWLAKTPLRMGDILWVIVTATIVLGIFAWIRLDLFSVFFPRNW